MEERHPSGSAGFAHSIVVFLGLLSFALCVAAEFKRSKKKDVRLDGKTCYSPASEGFGLGIGAIFSLMMAQIAGIFASRQKLCLGFGRGKRWKLRKPTVMPIALLSLSWISFGFAVILLGAASSMSREQAYGEGWLDGECYFVKGGVFVCSGLLVLIAAVSTLACSLVSLEKDKGQKARERVG